MRYRQKNNWSKNLERDSENTGVWYSDPGSLDLTCKYDIKLSTVCRNNGFEIHCFQTNNSSWISAALSWVSEASFSHTIRINISSIIFKFRVETGGFNSLVPCVVRAEISCFLCEQHDWRITWFVSGYLAGSSWFTAFNSQLIWAERMNKNKPLKSFNLHTCVNHDVYIRNTVTKWMELTSDCDQCVGEESVGGREGETGEKRQWGGGKRGGGDQRQSGFLGVWASSCRMLLLRTAPFAVGRENTDFLENILPVVFLFPGAAVHPNDGLRWDYEILSPHLSDVRYLSGGRFSPQARAWAWVCLSHNSVCVCLSVIVYHNLQVNLQITGHVCCQVLCVSLSVCVCACIVLWVCDGVCFSLGNKQVPLQSQTAGCSPQSLTPWYRAGEDAPPVACWSPGLSCRNLYDTTDRQRVVLEMKINITYSN